MIVTSSPSGATPPDCRQSRVLPARVTRRMVLAGGAAGGIASLAVSCSGTASAPPAPTAQPVKVTYMSRNAAGSRENQLEIELFQSFNQSQQRVIADVEATGAPNWGALKEKFVVRHTGGDPVDLVINNWGTWKDMSDGGMLAELTPFVKRDKVDLGAFIPSAVETHTDADKLGGMPASLSVDAMAYNVDLFAAAGLPHPPVNPDDKSWTMERFLEYAQKLTRVGEQFGFGGSYTGFGTVGTAG